MKNKKQAKKQTTEQRKREKLSEKLFKALEALPYTKEEANKIIEEGREDK